MELRIQSNADVEFRVIRCCRRCKHWIASEKSTDKIGSCHEEKNSRQDGEAKILQGRHQDSICGYFKSILKLVNLEQNQVAQRKVR